MLAVAGAWLARCCESLDRSAALECAALFLDDAEGCAACWPDPDDEPGEAVAAVAAAFASRRTVVRPREKDESGDAPAPGEVVAIPLGLGSRRQAVVSFVRNGDPAACDSAELEWQVEDAGRWLPLVLAGSDARDSNSHALLIKLVTALLEAEDARAAYLALASELATALACERVSLGLLEGTEVRLQAVSHSARFDVRTRLGRAIAAAMEEAVDSECGVRWPGEADKAPHRAHAQLCQQHEMGAALSVPLAAHGSAIGALTAEYRARHPAAPVIAARLEQIATVLGPLVAMRRADARSTAQRVWDGLRAAVAAWSGEQRRAPKLVAGVTAGLIAVLALWPGTYRVSANARLEGMIQRAIVAPIDGYVAESRVRAGDVITRGAELGRVDDTDLRLERRKWTARKAQLQKEYRAALAGQDRSQGRILRARLEQAAAELDLVEQQLARTKLIAPFDGVVAEGDLSRSLGSPVERGEVLFQVAPLDRYRIVLEVDETEIDEIEVGQRGWLKLTAQPGLELPLLVQRIVPIAVAEDRRNFFRVEARLDRPLASLRPGMEGVAKIETGRRSLLWIHTHSLIDWLRIRLWAGLP
jgi:RND family efflux transporter MFP subunit